MKKKTVISVLLTACLLFLLPGCSSTESVGGGASVQGVAVSGAVSESGSDEIQSSQADESENAVTTAREPETGRDNSEITSSPENSSPQGNSEAGTFSEAASQETASGSDASESSSPETSSPQESNDTGVSSAAAAQSETSAADDTAVPEPSQPETMTDGTLVVYFSCTGNTKGVAAKIADLCNADIYEIVPAEPYTSADLNYNDDNCRANREMNDESARPAIGGQLIDLSGYDTVFIGYPIWWGTMPRIINTFLDAYDLSGKTVMPFCTSGSSGISTSVSAIRSTLPDADVRDGLRASGADDGAIAAWISENGIQ